MVEWNSTAFLLTVWICVNNIKIKEEHYLAATFLFNWHAERDSTLAARSRLRSFAALTVYRTVIHYRSYFESLFPFYKNKEEPIFRIDSSLFGTLKGTRTPDPLLRRQMLYPAELSAHISL